VCEGIRGWREVDRRLSSALEEGLSSVAGSLSLSLVLVKGLVNPMGWYPLLLYDQGKVELLFSSTFVNVFDLSEV